MGAPTSSPSPTAAAAVSLAGRIGAADTYRGGGRRRSARPVPGHRRLQAHCGSPATGAGHDRSGGLAHERSRGFTPGPLAAPAGTGDRAGTRVAAGGVRAAIRIRTGGAGASIRSERELGVAPTGAGRAAARGDPTASAGGQDLRARRDEVSGAGGPHQPGRLRADGRGLRTASLRIATSRAAICRLAQWIGCDSQAHPRCAGPILQNAAADGIESSSGGRRPGVVARSGDGRGDCEPRSSPPGRRGGDRDGRYALRSGAAADRASAPSTVWFGGANRKGERSTC
jgi:hypothetical protein